jgi:molybdate transport system substrate-binding protein
MRNFATVLFLVASLIASADAAARDTITVYAAASLTNALQDVDAGYTKQTGTPVTESFASSSTLARQIEAGAPAQVFISADTKWMDYLAQKGLVANEVTFLGNELVLVAPADSPLRAQTIDRGTGWLDLLGRDGRLAVGDPDHVPAGIYAMEALERLGAWDTVEPRLARAEDVRGALALVERGDAPLGIVYATDARVSAKVRIVGTFPAGSHSEIVYPAATVKGADSAAVRDYFKYLGGAAARATFARYGFLLH